MTMDILWAISQQSQPSSRMSLPNSLFSGAAASVGAFSVPAPPHSDGSWELYEDYVGGVQFWGYGLVSGSGDGAVRMWDSKPDPPCLSSFSTFSSADRTGPSDTAGSHGSHYMPSV